MSSDISGLRSGLRDELALEPTVEASSARSDQSTARPWSTNGDGRAIDVAMRTRNHSARRMSNHGRTGRVWRSRPGHVPDCKYAIEAMLKTAGSICTSSIWALRPEAAIDLWPQVFARGNEAFASNGDRGIRVNAVAPGRQYRAVQRLPDEQRKRVLEAIKRRHPWQDWTAVPMAARSCSCSECLVITGVLPSTVDRHSRSAIWRTHSPTHKRQEAAC